MSKVTINEPDDYSFITEIDVTINLVNSAQHLGNENVIALMNEARIRYAQQSGLESSSGINYINADLAVVYKSEAFYGDRLKIAVAANGVHKYGCDFIFRITCLSDGRLIALGKMAMLAFDYQHSKACQPPENFWKALNLIPPQ